MSNIRYVKYVINECISFPIKFFKLSYFKMMTLSLTFTVVILAAKNIIAYYGYSNDIKDSEMISTREAISVANVDGDLYTEMDNRLEDLEQELKALKDADREEEAKEKMKKKQDMRRKHAKPLIKVDHTKSRMKSRRGIKKKKKNIRV